LSTTCCCLLLLLLLLLLLIIIPEDAGGVDTSTTGILEEELKEQEQADPGSVFDAAVAIFIALSGITTGAPRVAWRERTLKNQLQTHSEKPSVRRLLLHEKIDR